MSTTGISILFLACAILIGALAIPLIHDRVPPNATYGFRTQQTVSDPAIWYPANRYSGWQMLYAAIIQAVTALLLLIRAARIPPNTAALILVVTMLGTVIAATVRSLLYLKTLG